MSLVGLVVVLIVVGFGLYLVGLLPIDGTIKTIIRAVVILVVILWLVQALGLMDAGPRFHFR